MKVLAIFSGGMDSAVLLYHLRDIGHEVLALSFDYGQRHRKELEYAQALTTQIGLPHQIADISQAGKLFGKGSSQADPLVTVPEGHYSEENMRVTVVPNRNMIMLAIAAGVAIANGCEAVAFGAHAGDHAIYPDCRQEFADAMAQALFLCHEPGITLMRPFVKWTKADIAFRGSLLAVPFEKTWSCYKGGDRHCGKCGTCTERLEALSLAGVVDNTDYEDAYTWLDICK